VVQKKHKYRFITFNFVKFNIINIVKLTFDVLDKCLHSYSIITNMRNLTEDPKTKDFSVTNGLKTMGIISVIIGHRVALNLGILSFDSEHSEHVRKRYKFFSYNYLNLFDYVLFDTDFHRFLVVVSQVSSCS